MRRISWAVAVLTSGCAMSSPPPAMVAATPEPAAGQVAQEIEAATVSAPIEGALAYPETKRVDVVETQFGVPVTDPYRWLENDVRTDPQVEAWVQASSSRSNPRSCTATSARSDVEGRSRSNPATIRSCRRTAVS